MQCTFLLVGACFTQLNLSNLSKLYQKPWFMMKIQLGWPLCVIVGDPFWLLNSRSAGDPQRIPGGPRCTNFNRCGRWCWPWCAMPMRHWCEALKWNEWVFHTIASDCFFEVSPFPTNLTSGTSEAIKYHTHDESPIIKKNEELMKALGLTIWVSLWSLCVVASGLPGFTKWGRDGVGERWDLTDGHAHDVTLGRTGGASPNYAEYDIAPKSWTCFAWNKPAPLLFLTFALQYILLLWNGMPCQDDAIALSILADFHSRDVACHEKATACKADNTFCQWFRATCQTLLKPPTLQPRLLTHY